MGFDRHGEGFVGTKGESGDGEVGCPGSSAERSEGKRDNWREGLKARCMVAAPLVRAAPASARSSRT